MSVVLRPLLNDVLGSGNAAATLERLFDFVEETAHNLNLEVVTLIQTDIFEPLGGEPDRLAVASRHMGEKSKEVAFHLLFRMGGR